MFDRRNLNSNNFPDGRLPLPIGIVLYSCSKSIVYDNTSGSMYCHRCVRLTKRLKNQNSVWFLFCFLVSIDSICCITAS